MGTLLRMTWRDGSSIQVRQRLRSGWWNMQIAPGTRKDAALRNRKRAVHERAAQL